MWFAKGQRGASPYWLYALSNLGAMLGLVIYPFAVEPTLNLRWQARSWYAQYIVFALGLAASALSLRGRKEPSMQPAEKSGAGAAAVNSVMTTPTIQFL